MKAVLLSSITAVAALFALAGAAPQETPAERGAPMIPVLSATQEVGSTITACMYPGARPETYRVGAASCRDGASVCTVWVVMRTRDEREMLTGDFDLRNPPVEATGPTCPRPEFRPSGRLPSREP
jgi:hypothetical protein